MEIALIHSTDLHQKRLKNVKGLMLCRIIILTLLLVISFLFQVSEKKFFFIPLTNAFYYFIGLFYGVTVFYALLLRKVENLFRFTFIQIVIDHLFITGLIFFTGGYESFFPITYIFSIIGSSILFHRRGAFFSSSLSALLYGFLLLSQLRRWINPLGHPAVYEDSQIFYSFILYTAAFFIVAFLSSTISEELERKKRELIQKQVDYNQLETFNRNIIQSLDSGLLTTDLQGNINFLNPTAQKILDKGRKELKDVSIYDLFPKIGEVINGAMKKASGLSSDYERYETLLTDHGEKKIHLGFSISPLTGPEGALIGHTFIFQDITKFKEMEEQMKRFDKMAAIGSLAAGLAHEIRNPLASLSGSIQMLKSELPLDESQQHLMEIILRESERLNALITDFLLFAHPPQTTKIPMGLRRIIHETLEILVHSPSFHPGIRVIGPDGREEIEAMVDPKQMKQVFWNLFINALQAIPDGGEIRIQMEKGKKTLWGMGAPYSARKPGKDWVKIAITDSGEGIKAQEKEKIFEPFFTTKDGGTGLGLSIVHKIIENHNGLIKVESEVGRGSTFTVFLPTG